MGSQSFDPDFVVNLQRYPIQDKTDPRRTAIVQRLRSELDVQQYCVVPDFITPAALSAVLKEVDSIKASSYRNTSRRNCYLYREADATLPADHPKNLFFDASYSMIGNHLLPETSLLKGLYNWPGMIGFVADIVAAKVLYQNVDKYQPVNVNCFSAGDQSAWHFDSWNAFTLTLMLQAAESGGEFEIVPDTRSDADPKFDDLRKVLRGDRSRVVTVPREPRAMVIFRGCNSLHRVTPVAGPRQRLMSVFVYENEPGIQGDAKVNETVYGAPPAESGNAPSGRAAM
jgi:2OG-Fe(II) oxygenase superfamily